MRSAGLGLVMGALLIGAMTWTEFAVYPYVRGSQGGTWAVLGAGALIGIAVWKVRRSLRWAVGGTVALLVAVHTLTGVAVADRAALHERGRAVTATVQKEYVHREYSEDADPVTTYGYQVALPPGLPDRRLDAGATRLAIGRHVLVTVDPRGLAITRLGPPPGPDRTGLWILRGCDLLLLLLAAGLALAGSRRSRRERIATARLRRRLQHSTRARDGRVGG